MYESLIGNNQRVCARPYRNFRDFLTRFGHRQLLWMGHRVGLQRLASIATVVETWWRKPSITSDGTTGNICPVMFTTCHVTSTVLTLSYLMANSDSHSKYNRQYFVNVKSFPGLMGPQGSADLHFISSQPDTNWSWASGSRGMPVYSLAFASTH